MKLRRLAQNRRFRWLLLLCVVVIAAGTFLLPKWLPTVLSAWRSDIMFRVPHSEGQVFLTIDDAPSAATEQILDVLTKHGVTATFFITGSRVNDPAQLIAIRAAGNAVGHHMQTTRACSRLTLGEFQRDFDRIDSLLNLAEDEGARLFRPPSDFGTREQIAYAVNRGYRPVVGTAFPLDHWLEDPDALCDLALWLTVDGGIIILHDGSERGPRTAEVLDELIPRLKREGFRFGDLSRALETRFGPTTALE